MIRRKPQGFTLLEVLVALAVITIGLAAAIRAGASNGANAGYLRDKTFAQWVATNKATELQLLPVWPEPGIERGRTAMGTGEWSWSARISETVDARMRRVDIEVGPDADHTLVRLTAFLPRPARTETP